MNTSHWEQVYGSKAPDAVSWYAPHASIMDVGGGESTLVDDLLDAGFGNVTVLDISEKALEACRARWGNRVDAVKRLATDVLANDIAPQPVDVWHDRARTLDAAEVLREWTGALHG